MRDSEYTEDLEKTSRTLFPFYIGILILSPFPLGSNRPWAWSVLAAVSFVLLFIYLFQYGRGKIRPPEITKEIKFVCFILCLWLLFQLMQIIPLPLEIVQKISPLTIDVKQSLGINLNSLLAISIDKTNSGYEFIKSAWYAAIFALTIFLVQSRDRLRNVLMAIVVTGVVQAVIGLTMAFLDQQFVRSSIDPNYFSQVTGTFVNRNHFAGLMNMSIAAAIGLLIAVGLREKRRIHRDKHQHHWQSRMLDWRIYLVLYLCVMLVAMLFSQSQGALLSFSAMIIIVMCSTLIMKVELKSFYNNYKIPIIVVFLIVVFSSAELLVSKFTSLDTEVGARLQIWANTIKIVEDFWIAGVGTGNFQYIYPLYDDGSVTLKIHHAHNDFLELLAEQGVVGFSLLAIVILFWVKNILFVFLKSKSIKQNAYSIASLMAITGLLCHALVDFNFRIPSNVMYFFVFLAIAFLQGAKAVKVEKRDIAWDEEAFRDEREHQAMKPSMGMHSTRFR